MCRCCATLSTTQFALLFDSFLLIDDSVSLCFCLVALCCCSAYLEAALAGVRITDSVSALIALYCLFVTYWACKEVLHSVHPTRKFVSIKLLLFVCAVQEQLISLLLQITFQLLEVEHTVSQVGHLHLLLEHI